MDYTPLGSHRGSGVKSAVVWKNSLYWVLCVIYIL